MEMHYTQRERLRTIDKIRNWMKENTALSTEELETKAQHELGCTAERAKIYVREAIYK